jgi:hypothetical protein
MQYINNPQIILLLPSGQSAAFVISSFKRQLATEVTEKHRELQEISVASISPKGDQLVCCIFLFFL